MIYFATRSKARAFARKVSMCFIVDMKDLPSVNGRRWGVKVV